MAAAATVPDCLQAVLAGRDSSLLSYGKSGSGKTYTTLSFLRRILQELLVVGTDVCPIPLGPGVLSGPERLADQLSGEVNLLIHHFHYQKAAVQSPSGTQYSI